MSMEKWYKNVVGPLPSKEGSSKIVKVSPVICFAVKTTKIKSNGFNQESTSLK